MFMSSNQGAVSLNCRRHNTAIEHCFLLFFTFYSLLFKAGAIKWFSSYIPSEVFTKLIQCKLGKFWGFPQLFGSLVLKSPVILQSWFGSSRSFCGTGLGALLGSISMLPILLEPWESREGPRATLDYWASENCQGPWYHWWAQIPPGEGISQSWSCRASVLTQGIRRQARAEFPWAGRAPREPCLNCHALCITAWGEAALLSGTEGHGEEPLVLETQKWTRVTSQGRFLNDGIFTRQIRTAPLQRQGAGMWATQCDDNTTVHVQPTFSPASRSIPVLLYTAQWLKKWDTTPSSLASRIIYCWYQRKLSLPCPALACPYSSELLPEVLRQALLLYSPKKTFLTCKLQLKLCGFPFLFRLELLRDK